MVLICSFAGMRPEPAPHEAGFLLRFAIVVMFIVFIAGHLMTAHENDEHGYAGGHKQHHGKDYQPGRN